MKFKIPVALLFALFCISIPASAKVSEFKLICEEILFSVRDRAGLAKGDNQEIENWFSRLREFNRSPLAVDESSEQKMKRLGLIANSMGLWHGKISEILKSRGHLHEKHGTQRDSFSFQIDPDAIKKRWPEISHIEFPDSYQYFISPIRNLRGLAAAINPVTREMFLPVSILWDHIDDETRLTLLHESVHAQMAEVRMRSTKAFFAFLVSTQGARRESFATKVGSYIDLQFTGEEVLARAATVEARLHDFCLGGRLSMEQSWPLFIEMAEIHNFALGYMEDVLIPLIEDMRSSPISMRRTPDQGFQLVHGVEGLVIDIDPIPAAQLWSQDSDLARDQLLQSLMIELRVMESFRHFAYPVLSYAPVINLAKKDASLVDWRPFCRELSGLNAYLDALEIKRP